MVSADIPGWIGIRRVSPLTQDLGHVSITGVAPVAQPGQSTGLRSLVCAGSNPAGRTIDFCSRFLFPPTMTSCVTDAGRSSTGRRHICTNERFGIIQLGWARMKGPWVLHVVTDRLESRGPMERVIAALATAGVDAIQVREKGQPADVVWQTAQAALQAVRDCEPKPLVLINDRIDVALAVGASGVHLAGRSLRPEIARRLLPREMGWIIGVSVHSVEEARTAADSGADYVTFGQVIGSAGDNRGVDRLAAVVDAVSIPVLAIGGITPENVAVVLETGCAGVAVIRALLASDSPQVQVERFRAAMARSTVRPRRLLCTSSALIRQNS